MACYKRQTILDQLQQLLEGISTANGYNLDYERVEDWTDTPTEYKKNIIVYRDPREIYTNKGGNIYHACMILEVQAVVIETPTKTAQELGNLALEDLIKAVNQLVVCRCATVLKESEKWIETKGVTAAQVNLTFDAKYQFKL